MKSPDEQLAESTKGKRAGSSGPQWNTLELRLLHDGIEKSTEGGALGTRNDQ